MKNKLSSSFHVCLRSNKDNENRIKNKLKEEEENGLNQERGTRYSTKKNMKKYFESGKTVGGAYL